MSGMQAKVLLAAAAAACVYGSASAASVSYGFNVLENNSPIDLSGQLSVSVSDHRHNGNALAPGQVSFVFTNIGPLQGSLTDVYFDDGTLLGIATISDSSGVEFHQGANPHELPGHNAIDFDTTAGFLADSDSPTTYYGVNHDSEWLEIVFNLINGQTYQDTIAALNGADLNQDGIADLRIGLKVQGLWDGCSETYVNGTPPPPPGNMVPLPSTAGLAAAGLLLVGTRRRR